MSSFKSSSFNGKISNRVDNSTVSSWKLLETVWVCDSNHILLQLEQSSMSVLTRCKTTCSSSKQSVAEGERTRTGNRSSSSKRIWRSFDFRMRDSEFRFWRNWSGFKVEISWDNRWRDWTRFLSESFGDMNDPADGRRFLGGKVSGDMAMENELPENWELKFLCVREIKGIWEFRKFERFCLFFMEKKGKLWIKCGDGLAKFVGIWLVFFFGCCCLGICVWIGWVRPFTKSSCVLLWEIQVLCHVKRRQVNSVKD